MIMNHLAIRLLLAIIVVFALLSCAQNTHTISSGHYLVDNFEQTPGTFDNHSISTGAVNAVSYYNLLTEYEKQLYMLLYKTAVERRSSVTIAGNVDTKTVSRVMRSIVNDHPELIWINEGYSREITMINGEITETVMRFRYNALADNAAQYLEQMDKIASQILANIENDNGAVGKEKYIHDYLIQNVKYIQNAYDQNAYGALVMQQAMCSGYARAFKYLLDRLGIPNYVVTGRMTADGITANHAWNLVVIDGHCYNVDVTSDEVEIIKGKQHITKPDDRLFNKSDREFKKLGYIRESEYSDEVVKLPACD